MESERRPLILGWPAARQADGEFRLGNEDVHVWHTDLSQASADRALLGLLDDEERARGSRLRQADDRAQFISAHAFVRVVLGRYLGVAPQALRFARSATGKPYLIQDGAPSDLRFNPSRTPGCGGLALTLGRDIGLDVERIADSTALAAVVERALTEGERAFLGGLAPSERQPAFYTLWARKEAFLKGRGDGLAIAPAEVDTASPAGRIKLSGKPQRDWRVRDLGIAPSYAAAVAAKGTKWRVTFVRSFSMSAEMAPIASDVQEGLTNRSR